MTLEELIAKIISAYRRVGAPEPPKASAAALEELRDSVSSRYGILLPAEYEAVLRQADGIVFDGVCLFGSAPLFRDSSDEWPISDGLLEANEGFEVDGVAIPDTLCFGDDGSRRFCLNLKSGQFGSYSTVDGKVRDRFASFADMFRHMYEPRVRER